MESLLNKHPVFPDYKMKTTGIQRIGGKGEINHIIRFESYVRIKREDKWYLIRLLKQFEFIPLVDICNISTAYTSIIEQVDNYTKIFITDCMNVYHLYKIDLDSEHRLFEVDLDQRETEDILKQKYNYGKSIS